jgi:glucokinase
MDNVFIGIDLGGTNVKIGCFDQELNLIAKTSIPVDKDETPAVFVEQTAQATEKLLTDCQHSMQNLSAVGIGSTGQFDLRRGYMISNPNLKQFQGVPLREMIENRFNKPVVLENDGNAACYGEYTCGAGKGAEHMVFFTLGTGIGGGIIHQGKLIHGATDNAAELGHIIIWPDGRKCGCGQFGCAEAHASASSTANRALEAVKAGAESTLQEVLSQTGTITCKNVFDHAKAGDAFALEIVDGTAKTLGILCVNILHSTDPDRIIFAGGMIAAGDFLLSKILAYFDKFIWIMKSESVEICFATLGQDAGIIGAAALGRQAAK